MGPDAGGAGHGENQPGQDGDDGNGDQQLQQSERQAGLKRPRTAGRPGPKGEFPAAATRARSLHGRGSYMKRSIGSGQSAEPVAGQQTFIRAPQPVRANGAFPPQADGLPSSGRPRGQERPQAVGLGKAAAGGRGAPRFRGSPGPPTGNRSYRARQEGTRSTVLFGKH